MPFKVDIQTLMDDDNMDIETCQEMLKVLETAYDNVRIELYTRFFSYKTLRVGLGISLLLLLYYYASHNIYFLYSVPLSFMLVMLSLVGITEIATKVIKDSVRLKIVQVQKKLSALKKQAINKGA